MHLTMRTQHRRRSSGCRRSSAWLRLPTLTKKSGLGTMSESSTTTTSLLEIWLQSITSPSLPTCAAVAANQGH
jgi:hypothetical protein